MNYKEFKQYVDKTNKNIADKLKDNEEELAFYAHLVVRFNAICEENEELKKQFEPCYCNRSDCASRIKDSKKYDSLEQKIEKQQQEFITYLTSYIELLSPPCSYNNQSEVILIKTILSRYKEIIGVKDENNT